MVHGDPVWMKSLLVVHIACGFASFLLAPVALATAKGGKQHKRWGMVYLWAMGGVAATALPMALYRPVLFLALVAVFSFYAAFSGYRVLKLKDLSRGGRAKAIDWFAGGMTFVSSACLAGFGVWRTAWVQHMGLVAVVFGLVGMRLAAVQMLSFVRKPTEKMFWWYTHLGNFIGSYIAAWTAFSVVSLPQVLPHAGFVLWLWPTAVGVPAIVLTSAYLQAEVCSEGTEGCDRDGVGEQESRVLSRGCGTTGEALATSFGSKGEARQEDADRGRFEEGKRPGIAEPVAQKELEGDGG